jgi:hypothetical protein
MQKKRLKWFTVKSIHRKSNSPQNSSPLIYIQKFYIFIFTANQLNARQFTTEKFTAKNVVGSRCKGRLRAARGLLVVGVNINWKNDRPLRWRTFLSPGRSKGK